MGNTRELVEQSFPELSEESVDMIVQETNECVEEFDIPLNGELTKTDLHFVMGRLIMKEECTDEIHEEADRIMEGR